MTALSLTQTLLAIHDHQECVAPNEKSALRQTMEAGKALYEHAAPIVNALNALRREEAEVEAQKLPGLKGVWQRWSKGEPHIPEWTLSHDLMLETGKPPFVRLWMTTPTAACLNLWIGMKDNALYIKTPEALTRGEFGDVGSARDHLTKWMASHIAPQDVFKMLRKDVKLYTIHNQNGGFFFDPVDQPHVTMTL